MGGETPVQVAVQRLPGTEDLSLPEYATAGAAGLDLVAAVVAPVVLEAGDRALVPTGLKLALPAGTEGQIRPRSGLALEHGVSVLNSPGTIDSDYRGEVAVLLVNLGTEPFTIFRGMRVAQLVVAEVRRAKLSLAAALPETARGGGGFGSTGAKPRLAAFGKDR